MLLTTFGWGLIFASDWTTLMSCIDDLFDGAGLFAGSMGFIAISSSGGADGIEF